jgi:hypothetical protein
MNTETSTTTPDQTDEPLPAGAGGASAGAGQPNATEPVKPLDQVRHLIDDTLRKLSRRGHKPGRKV